MTDRTLEAIAARNAVAGCDDRAALLAEVRRLRAELAYHRPADDPGDEYRAGGGVFALAMSIAALEESA